MNLLTGSKFLTANIVQVIQSFLLAPKQIVLTNNSQQFVDLDLSDLTLKTSVQTVLSLDVNTF